jgi:hypothetical protein
MYYNIWLIYIFFKRVEWRVEDACEWGLSKWSVSLCHGFVQGKWKSTEESVEMTFLSLISFCSLLVQDIIDLSHHEHEHMIAWSRGHLFFFLRIYFQRGSSINDGFSSPKWFFLPSIIFIITILFFLIYCLDSSHLTLLNQSSYKLAWWSQYFFFILISNSI